MSSRFGESRLDRRTVLQTLGVTIASVFLPPACFAPASWIRAWLLETPAPGRTFAVTTVNHLALSSRNYVTSRDFYVDLFGMRVAWDNGRGCALEFGSLTSPNGMYIRPVAKTGDKPTIGHIAFGIPNFVAQKPAMRAELLRRGVRNIHADGERGLSCIDPAGYPLDIWVPEKDPAMFPGAAGPCRVAVSAQCRAGWEAGEKNLGSVPKPGGRGFTGTAYSLVTLTVSNLEVERDFYRSLLGMRVIYDQADGPDAQCLLKFGQNTLQLRKSTNVVKPSCDRFGITVENFNRDAVEAELKRRGLRPVPNSRLSWTISDPDGYTIDVSGAGFSEHLANDCHGASATCPGGPTG